MFAFRLLAVCLCANIATLTPAHAADATFGDANRGRAIFASNCANCHEANGRALSKAYPVLAGQQPQYLAAQLTNFKTGSRADLIMTQVSAGLAPPEIRDVAAYIGTIPAPASRAAASTRPAAERLFSRGDPAAGIPACQSCHGARGKGLSAAGIPRVAGQSALYLWAALEAFKSGERGPDGGNVMGMVASRLSAQEVQDLAYYVAGLD